METLHDIYPQQDKNTIESVLQSFDYDVAEAVQWFTDVPAPNLDTRVNDTARQPRLQPVQCLCPSQSRDPKITKRQEEVFCFQLRTW